MRNPPELSSQNGLPQASVVKPVIIDRRGVLRPEKIALIRFLSLTPNLRKVRLAELLYEDKIGHIDDYFKLRDQYKKRDDRERARIAIIEGLTTKRAKEIKLLFDFFVRETGNTYSLDSFVFDRLPLEFRDTYKFSEMNDLLRGLSYWETRIVSEGSTFKRQVDELKHFIDLGLRAIVDKYQELIEGVPSDLRQTFLDVIRDSRSDVDSEERYWKEIYPRMPEEFTRHFFEVWAKAIDVMVLGYKYGEIIQQSLFKSLEIVKIIRKNVASLESCHRDGTFGIPGYERSLVAKDVGLILRTLANIGECFPALRIDKRMVRQSRDFLTGTLESVNGILCCPVKQMRPDYMRQITLNATLEALLGIHYASRLLGNLNGSTSETKEIIRYILSLWTREGGFAMARDVRKADMEATAFIIYTLLDKEQLFMNEQSIEKLTEWRMDCGRLIKYMYDNRKIIRAELIEKRYLHLPILYAHALLLCGVYPFSSHILDVISEVVREAEMQVEEIVKIPIWRTGGFTPEARILLPKILSTLNVLTHSIGCLCILTEYVDKPATYWDRISRLVKYSKSLRA